MEYSFFHSTVIQSYTVTSINTYSSLSGIALLLLQCLKSLTPLLQYLSMFIIEWWKCVFKNHVLIYMFDIIAHNIKYHKSKESCFTPILSLVEAIPLHTWELSLKKGKSRKIISSNHRLLGQLIVFISLCIFFLFASSWQSSNEIRIYSHMWWQR